MIQTFSALAFPWYTFGAEGKIVERSDGSLFKLPSGLNSPPQEAFYAKTKINSWTICPSGYAVLTREVTAPYQAKLVVPGLKVRGLSRAQGKTDVAMIVTERAVVENHIDVVIASIDRAAEEFDQVTRQNVHEIRGLNSGIYQAAQEIEELTVSRPEARYIGDLAGNISALTRNLSARMDFLTYFSNPEFPESDLSDIPVYRKVDKMVRCFKAKAHKSKIQLALQGSSYGNTFGPKSLFEIIPYLILDNAVKYSPRGATITTEISESGEIIVIRITSTGPRIEDDEVVNIFSSEFRGRNAKKTGKEGSGIGLAVLKRLVEDSFYGEVELYRGSNSNVQGGVPYSEVSFLVSLPRTS